MDVTVTSFTGKTCTATKQEYAVGGGEITVDKTRLSAVITRAAKVIQENPDSTGIKELKASYNLANTLYLKTDVTQVEVNQTVRDLKGKIKAVGNVIVCQHTNTVTNNVKEATCTEAGYTGDIYCADCNELQQTGQTIPAKGHQWDDGTELGDGYIKYICTVCQEIKNVRKDGYFDIEVNVGQYVYDGLEKRPEVIAKDGNMVLKENTDYKITYLNNINAGTATVKVEGIGSYTRIFEQNFTIEQAEVPPNKPIDMNVSVETGKLSAVELSNNRKWSDEDKDKVVEMGKNHYGNCCL